MPAAMPALFKSATARAGMLTVKGNGGKVLNVTPDVLLVHPSLEKAALEIVSAQRLANAQVPRQPQGRADGGA